MFHLPKTRRPRAGLWAGWLLAAYAALLAFAGGAAAQTPPDQLVKSVSDEVLGIVRTDTKIQEGDPKRIAEVIEVKLLPHFDFTRMTALAMGRNWNLATPEQKQALTQEFRTLLVRTYSGALNNYRDYQINLKPMRANPGDTDVTVRTAVMQPAGQPIAIDYSMHKTPEGWKCYDVIIAGVSLVTNYREEFNAVIKESGVDGLVKTLSQKNEGSRA